MQAHKYMSQKAKKLALDTKIDIEDYHSKLEGIWHSNISFDGITYWDPD